jgi:hypothetical protein
MLQARAHGVIYLLCLSQALPRGFMHVFSYSKSGHRLKHACCNLADFVCAYLEDLFAAHTAFFIVSWLVHDLSGTHACL